MAATVTELRRKCANIARSGFSGWSGPTIVSVSTQLRDESPGYHHVVTRGNNKRTIYIDDRDRIFFCLTVQRIARKYGWTVLAYCLMNNRYAAQLSRSCGMQCPLGA